MRLLFGLLVLLAAAGCATNKGTINTFYEAGYQQGSIQALAVPAIRNARLAPSESQQIARGINRAIQSKNPHLNLISANQFGNLLNEKDLVDDYSDFIEDYVRSGISDRGFLAELESSGIDAILLSELSNVRQEDGTFGISKGQTRVTMSFTVIESSSGDVVWSSSADGIRGTVTTVGDAPPIAEAVELAIEKIEESIPRL